MTLSSPISGLLIHLVVILWIIILGMHTSYSVCNIKGELAAKNEKVFEHLLRNTVKNTGSGAILRLWGKLRVATFCNLLSPCHNILDIYWCLKNISAFGSDAVFSCTFMQNVKYSQNTLNSLVEGNDDFQSSPDFYIFWPKRNEL